MINKRQLAGLGFGAVVVAVSACAPTIRLEVAPIQIYAKLDADVRVRLDQELTAVAAEPQPLLISRFSLKGTG